MVCLWDVLLYGFPVSQDAAPVFQGRSLKVILEMFVEGRGISKTTGVCYLGYRKIGFQEQLSGDFDAVLD